MTKIFDTDKDYFDLLQLIAGKRKTNKLQEIQKQFKGYLLGTYATSLFHDRQRALDPIEKKQWT